MPSLSFLTIGNTRVKVHTTYDANTPPTPQAPLAAEELPIQEIILDKTGRLLIDVVDNTPRGKQTYRHRVSLDTMKQASPVWKETIFGPEGQELEMKPTANDHDHDHDHDHDRLVVLPADDEPVPILVQLALIHDQPRWVPTWSDPATPGSSAQIAKIVTAAAKYGVLPRLRPCVPDWLLHARPPARIGGQDDVDSDMMDQLNVAWQLGDARRVEVYIRKLAFDSNLAAEVAEDGLVEVGDCPVDRFPALPALMGVAARRREEGIQACLDFVAGLVDDLDSDEGVCRRPMWDPTIILGYTPEAFAAFEWRAGPAVDHHKIDRDLCGVMLNMDITKRLQDEGPIPELANDFHSSITHLLYKIRRVHGIQDGAAPILPVPGHACLQRLQTKFEDFAAELRGRWSGTASILEADQVEWLKTRRDMLATGGSS